MEKMKQKADQVRIFITDSEAVYRKGIRWALSGDDAFDVIGEASTNIETLESILKTPADLLILNANHNKPSGIDVTRYVTHRLPNVKVILMMDEYRTEYVIGAIKSGAKACVGKSIDLDSLLKILHQVIDDVLPISNLLKKPEVADAILHEYELSAQNKEENDEAHIGLVKSEQAILKGIRNDASMSDVTASLNISEEILTEYLNEIVEKLVKIEYYKENPEQRYISNLISKSTGKAPSRQYSITHDLGSRFHTGTVESNVSDELPSDIRVRSAVEKIENTNVFKQPSELKEPESEKSENIDLARKPKEPSNVYELNQNIMNITEDLLSEIDHRRQILRRIKKAIEFELEVAHT